MSVHLNRYLDKKEQVDHIDNDKLNDTISNLQILTPRENNIKKNEHLGIKSQNIDLICPICGVEFSRTPRQVRYKIVKGKLITCSRVCGGKMSHITAKNNKND